MHTKLLYLVILFIGFLGHVPAHALERHIHVNGDHLSVQDIAVLDHLANKQVPDGYYWIKFDTGAWGYEDNKQTQGQLDMSRVKKNAEANSGNASQSSGNAQSSSSSTPQGTLDPSLIGAWINRKNASNGIYLETQTNWVFSSNGTVGWGTGTIIAGGTANVSLRGGGNSSPEYGRWAVKGDQLFANWDGGTRNQWTYSIFEYDGRPALSLTLPNGKRFFLKKTD